MKKIQYYGRLLFVAIYSVSLFFSQSLAAMAADYNGKPVFSINIIGNREIPEETIKPIIKIKPGDMLLAEKVKQDLQAIYELGYFADVSANFSQAADGIQVSYTVIENPVLRSVIFQGNTKVPTDKLMSMIKVSKGQIINTKIINENMRNIEQYYHEQGYVLAKVSDVALGMAGELTVSISEGLLEGIKIKGNKKTKDYVITREMKLKIGQPFNAKAAKRSMQKVYNLGYFEDVNMKLNPGREPNAVVLETDVVEQKNGVFSIGGGYSHSDGLTGIIEIGDNNFRGIGDKTSLLWEFGGKAGNRNYQFSYTRPWLNNNVPASLGFNIYNMTKQYNDYENDSLVSTYDRKRKGWDISYGYPQGEYIQNYITLKQRKDNYVKSIEGIDYLDGKHQQYLLDNFGLTRSITLLRVFDSRDNVFNATQGRRYSLAAEFAGSVLGGNFNFSKYEVENRQYFKVGHTQIIAIRIGLGYAAGHLPDNSKFLIGGMDTLRGYAEDKFKGSKMFNSSAEYRFPIVKKVQGVFFTDCGNAWEDKSYKLDNLKYSFGTGIRLNTPLGPIRLDYAKGSEGDKYHFGFGGQF